MAAPDDEAIESFDNRPKVYLKAGMLLVLGTVIAGIFADPLVHAVDDFSSATNIPSFFVSFIALPLAMSSGEAATALIFASRKKKRTASLAFSEVQTNPQLFFSCSNFIKLFGSFKFLFS